MRKLIKKITPEFILDWKREQRIIKEIKLNSGENVSCPICNSEFKEFAPFGLVTRKNARCYKCSSLERHRLLFKYLNEKTDLFRKENKVRLLHFAPEKVFYDIFSKRQNIDYYPSDLQPERYNHKGPVSVKKVDVTKIPYPENNFDVILCNHVLEHIPDDFLAMSELFRV